MQVRTPEHVHSTVDAALLTGPVERRCPCQQVQRTNSDAPLQHSVMPTVYTVYVIELSRKVYTEHWKFRAANPQYNGALECLYVGMTSKTPRERFAQHKTGALSKKGHDLSSAIVKKYGRYLRPSLYQHIGPLSQAEALEVEKGLALELRRKGYAVWTN